MLLDANGYSRDQLFSNPEQIVHIEMFLHEYPKVEVCFASFCFLLRGFSIYRLACLFFSDVWDAVFSIHQKYLPHSPGQYACTYGALWLACPCTNNIGLGMLQGIKEIACLENCVNLEKLWIVENEIKVIQGLDNLRNLKELYLYSNRIGRIENLGQLTNLEVLTSVFFACLVLDIVIRRERTVPWAQVCTPSART